MRQLEKRQLRVGRHILHYEAAGEGIPIVFIHGLSGSTRWWKKNISYLAQHYRVYLIDLIGFGQSRRQTFALEQSSDMIVDWMENLQIRDVNLIGHSMGGYIAAEIALYHPEKVSRLILVSAAAVPLRKGYLTNFSSLLKELRYVAPDFYPVLIKDAFQAGPRTLLRAFLEIYGSDISGMLPQIKTPTLIIWGENDSLLPLDIGKKLYDSLSGSTLLIFKDVGHLPMWERPRQFNQAVVQFIEGGSLRLPDQDCRSY